MTLEEIKERFKYDPETGDIFIWNLKKKKYELLTYRIHGYIRAYVIIDNTLRTLAAHRIAYQLYHNIEELEDLKIDHINHIKDDNRISNLRLVTVTENQHNRTKSRNNTSGIGGVELYKGKFRARIGINGKQISLGTFGSLEEAIVARNNGKTKYGFHENHE